MQTPSQGVTASPPITHYCGVLKGIIEGGFEILFNHVCVGCSPSNIRYILSASKKFKETSKVDLEDEIHQLYFELVEEA
jgi:hypothetical protein